MVQDLLNQIVEKTGVPADKAQQVLGLVANFVKEKFPMVGGQIDSVLGTGAQGVGASGVTANPLGDIGGKMGF